MSKTIAEKVTEILGADTERIKKLAPCVIIGMSYCPDGVCCQECREGFWGREAEE